MSLHSDRDDVVVANTSSISLSTLSLSLCSDRDGAVTTTSTQSLHSDRDIEVTSTSSLLLRSDINTYSLSLRSDRSYVVTLLHHLYHYIENYYYIVMITLYHYIVIDIM